MMMRTEYTAKFHELTIQQFLIQIYFEYKIRQTPSGRKISSVALFFSSNYCKQK